MSILLKQLKTQFYNYFLTTVCICFVYLACKILTKLWKFYKKRQIIDQISGPPSTWNPLGHINKKKKKEIDMIKSKYILNLVLNNIFLIFRLL